MAMKILAAEDVVTSRVTLAFILRRYGYAPIMVCDGEEAWEKLNTDPEIQLVLSDWMMPNLNGLELCQRIRNTNIGRYIYLILLSANPAEEAVIEALEAGADDFISKPFNVNELRVRLRAGERIVNLEQSQERNLQQLRTAYAQIREDLQAAAAAQRALLPPAGCFGDIQFAWLFETSDFLGGDMFNFFELGKEYWGFYQLDVAGHGVKAALLSFALYRQIQISKNPFQPCLLMQQNASGNIPVPPGEVLYRLNNLFEDTGHPSPEYFTIVYGYLHKTSGALALAQAGHPSPVLLDRHGKARLLGEGGFPVGMLADMEYDTLYLELAPGERLFLYSDGVSECANPEQVLFTEARLLADLETSRHLSLDDTLTQLHQSLSVWHQREIFDDDITVLALGRETPIR